MKYQSLLSILAYAASVSAAAIQARDSDAQLTVTSLSPRTNVAVEARTPKSTTRPDCFRRLSAPTMSLLITGGSGFTNNNCFLHIFSDDGCSQRLADIGPIMESNGYPVSPPT
ncbi:hypothetical protein M409DRAFT_52249 [Zasmidium cellare ATCC 36951]|uniref:Uncharacterized protein n=1 Tax=Zasmidium cellare ATCC 36951 TaxID=1080233 RepID=A0A6A6CVA5_ZASCE|nr:uncharacterized protein M409DRAFT_52249 [Zasmidium cellare ATCC 36951]KAF2169742.1 hypothetical protein M409DRAFT_52249 [Zasmidium cellare ATCC 36951]